LNVTDGAFELETLAGCIEYKPLMDIVVNAFFVRDGKHCLSSERNLYVVICYLATFQLEELGLQQFSRIVKSLDIAKMYKPKIEQLIKQLADKLANRVTTVKTSTVTKPKEFDLTTPKPRAITIPEPIPLQEKHRPVPQSTYKPPKEKQHLQEIKYRNRRRAEIDNVPIKLNATAILREGAHYQRKMEQELNRIESLLRGAHDASEFLEWQKQMREKDLEQQLAEIECRRLQGKLSHEEAVLAHQNVIQENKKKAELKREETAELMHQYAEKRLQEAKEMRELVEQVVEGHKNVKQARMKLQKYKRQIVQEVSEESRELLRQALEEEEEKIRKRYELIQQIRAIEALPFFRNKFVDLTQTAGYGFSGEMSIVELRERLALLKEAQKKAEEEKRDQIIHEKQAKEQQLLDKLEQISVFRAALGRAAALKQEEKKIKSRLTEGPVKDERVLDLQKKIIEKTMERKKQAEILKITPQKDGAGPGRSWESYEALTSSSGKWSNVAPARSTPLPPAGAPNQSSVCHILFYKIMLLLILFTNLILFRLFALRTRTQRKRRGGAVNSRQTRKRNRLVASATEMASEAEPIELEESAGEEVVDLTCESSEPVVVDLTHNDSVVVKNQRQRRNLGLRSQRQSDSCVLSSDDEDESRDNDVYVTNKVSGDLETLEDETASSSQAWSALSESFQVTMPPRARRSPVWSNGEVLDLISVCGEEAVQSQLCSSHRNYDTFGQISRAMLERGHDQDALQCRVKVKELQNAYRKACKANSCSGAGPATCCFYEELDAILGGDPTSTLNTTMDITEASATRQEEEEEQSGSQGAEEEEDAPGCRDARVALKPGGK
ncbi:E3 ubiquitin ligase RNF4, partial [Chelonia mydas]